MSDGPTWEEIEKMATTVAAFDRAHPKAIMCPGCGRLHHGPGGFCSAACAERSRQVTHQHVTAVYEPMYLPAGRFRYVVPEIHGFTDALGAMRESIAGALAAITLVALLNSRARRRAAGYRYLRKRARKERLGFGVPLMSVGGSRLPKRLED